VRPTVPVLALLLLLLAAACAPVAPMGGTPSPAAPAPTDTATAAITGSPTASALQQALVVRVVDGDTIDILIGGETLRLRYIGVDTPETVDPRRPVGCFGKEASARNRELVDGKTVGLEKDVSETDRYGRLLRYVWLEGRMVNAQLVEEGYATASTYPPDVRHADLFANLQAQARQAGRGLWGACATPGAPSPTAAAGAACDRPSIKGNISSAGEKIYHVPGGAFYEDTQIDEAKGERWFCTEAEAVAAGWRKSKR